MQLGEILQIALVVGLLFAGFALSKLITARTTVEPMEAQKPWVWGVSSELSGPCL